MDLLLALLSQTPRADWSWNLNDSADWSRDKAVTLANCALLVYNDEDVIREHLQKRGFLDVSFIQSKTPGVDTQAFVGVRPEAVVIAFRGTEPTNPVDFFTDFTTARVDFEAAFKIPGWGKVWGGWAEGVQAVLPEILEKLALHDDEHRSLWITGHSLGGALAVVLASIISNLPAHPIQGVYTYGQPRVGDPNFCRRYDSVLGTATFRHVNDKDLVPQVPPRNFTRLEQQAYGVGGILKFADMVKAFQQRNEVYEYDHIGTLCLLLPQGGCSSERAEEEKRAPEFLRNDRTNLKAGLDLARMTLEAASRLKDHAPINPISNDGYIERLEALEATTRIP